MKYLITAILFLTIPFSIQAKKVKFACDMTGITVLPTGMHISGDFQTLAGFPGGDWNSASTPLTQEPGTDIYSIVVDIPAFAKYEYKFVNGDQFYEAEFVPEFSRVGYNFNDNRWLYVDSTANDTTFVGAIIFAGNAPAGMKLVRFYVDMQNETVSSNGVYIAGSYQGWNTTSDILYSFGGSVYEVINYMPVGTYEYKFYNGNSGESIIGSCTVNGNREISVVDDVLVNSVCFGLCGSCLTGLIENAVALNIKLIPNPATSVSRLNFGTGVHDATVKLYDISGRLIRSYSEVSGLELLIDRDHLLNGMYFITVSNDLYSPATARLVLQ